MAEHRTRHLLRELARVTRLGCEWRVEPVTLPRPLMSVQDETGTHGLQGACELECVKIGFVCYPLSLLVGPLLVHIDAFVDLESWSF